MSEQGDNMIKKLDEISEQYQNADKSDLEQMNRIGFDAIAAIADLPDIEFNGLSTVILQKMRETANTSEFIDELTANLASQGTTVEQYLASYQAMMDDIDEIFRDKYDHKRLTFIHQMLTIEWQAMAEHYKYHAGLEVKYELVRDGVIIPSYAHDTDSGMDVFALEDYTIEPGDVRVIPTGFKVAIPFGYELQVRPKSGRSARSYLRIANTPGTIDSGYRNEVGIIVENIAPIITDVRAHKTEEGIVTSVEVERGPNEVIEKGKAFAQLVLTKVEHASMQQVESVADMGEDRGGGFGSTERG